MSESLVMVDSAKGEESRKSQELWRFFSDKPITLTELLESSPEARQLKKFNFDCSSNNSTGRRWGQSSGGTGGEKSCLEGRTTTRKSNLPSFTSESISTTSSGSTVNLDGSKLSLLDSLGPIEPSESLGKRKLKKLRKEEKDRTKGTGWFDMPRAELTQERKNDIEALQLRSALDTKRFYKRNSLATRPKYFQVGRIVDNPIDFYHSRVPRKQRKKTIAEEMVQEVSSTVSHL